MQRLITNIAPLLAAVLVILTPLGGAPIAEAQYSSHFGGHSGYGRHHYRSSNPFHFGINSSGFHHPNSHNPFHFGLNSSGTHRRHQYGGRYSYGRHYSRPYYYRYRTPRYYGGSHYRRGYSPRYSSRYAPRRGSLSRYTGGYRLSRRNVYVPPTATTDLRHLDEGARVVTNRRPESGERDHRVNANAYERRAEAQPDDRDDGIIHDDSSLNGGWRLLAQGRALPALNVFTREAPSRPRAGLPKVGYSLASAMTHSDSTAAWAMRRALRYEAGVLDHIPQSEELQYQLRELLGYYHPGEADDPYRGRDGAFLSAALAYMLGDYATADHAIDHAVEAGDHDSTTRTLQDMIDQRIDDEHPDA